MKRVSFLVLIGSTIATTGCGTVPAPASQSDFQDQIESSGIVPPDFGFQAYPDGMFLWSSQSAPDIANPAQALGTRGTDRARNWVWDRTNVTMFPLLDSSGMMAVGFGGQLAFDNTYLFTFAASDAVVGNPVGWGVGTEDTENESYVFYKADECGRPVYDICLNVDADGNPGPDDCDGMYVAPDCADYGDTGE
jgi:hypothetical protein